MPESEKQEKTKTFRRSP